MRLRWRMSTNVSSFGVAHEDQDWRLDVRRQIDVLYAHVKPDAREADEFALGPSRDSKPNQMVIACVSPKARLRDTLEYVERKIDEHSSFLSCGSIMPNCCASLEDGDGGNCRPVREPLIA